MVFGVIACLLYERTGSLYPSMALHGLIDGGAFEAAISGHTGIVYAAYGALGLLLLAYAGIRHFYLGTRSTRFSERPHPLIAATDQEHGQALT
jgi:hypothetical protein